MSLPATQRALTVAEPGRTVVLEKALPKFEPEKILVKVKAVALNPADWKQAHYHIKLGIKPGSSLGLDFAGDIVQIGAGAEGKGFHVGDAVSGFVRAGVDPDNGAFQEYVAVFPELIWRKPASVSYEDAAAMSIVVGTAAQALYYRLSLPKPWELAVTRPTPVLIWAGSTAVGLSAIQLAKLSGLRIATTASPKNHQLLKDLGAEAVFDYRDPEAPNKIREWAEQYGGLRYALDCISEQGSTNLVADAFGSQSGKIIVILTPAKDQSWPANVEVEHTLLFDVLDKSNDKDFADIQEWYKYLPGLVEKGKVSSVPLKHWEGGLAGISEALDYLRQGKVSAEKIVLTL
ncbi:hypothetical protein BOTBODRAFT_176897 [Botryobasidium botryosum FD-172 SS1]|uniref:Enoyl reductase (ER) domain-containing protein n=1 Tax=Botryobasidium botryosum (strain FD-172 SS1) TaxID=930990 RepID=A0A067MK21_BOTB1|nr:hypothetical protein BOTBODRAFT_176897 [Botryobasidium botryosum FD-172 SS1]